MKIAIELYLLCGVAWMLALINAYAIRNANLAANEGRIVEPAGWPLVRHAIGNLAHIAFWPVTIVRELVRA